MSGAGYPVLRRCCSGRVGSMGKEEEENFLEKVWEGGD